MIAIVFNIMLTHAVFNGEWDRVVKCHLFSTWCKFALYFIIFYLEEICCTGNDIEITSHERTRRTENHVFPLTVVFCTFAAWCLRQ